MRTLAALVFASVAAVGCGSSNEASSVANQDLIGGTAAGAKYEAVGALVEGDAKEPFCTATLVSPTLVITAKHCLEGGSEDDPQPKDVKTVTFWYGESLHAASGAVGSKRSIEAPDFDHPDFTTYGSDVMLAELEQPLVGVPFIPVSKSPVTDAELGHAFDVVGFGVRAENGLGAAEGEREVGSFVLEATTGNAFEKRFGSRVKFDEYYAKVDPQGSADELGDAMWLNAELNAHYEVMVRSEKTETCYGDSGGPLLRKTANGNLEVVGVVSTGFPGETSSCLHLGTVFAVFGPKTAQFLKATGL